MKMMKLWCYGIVFLMSGLVFLNDVDAAGVSTYAYIYHSQETIYTVLTSERGTVIATVDGFPILQEDVDFAFKYSHLVGHDKSEEEIFNGLVEDRAAFSQAAALGVLPNEDEIIVDLEERKKDILASDETMKYVREMISALGISEEEYWYGLEKYNQYRLAALDNLYEAIIQQGHDEKMSDLDSYYAEMRLEWKQNCPIILNTNCPYALEKSGLVHSTPKTGHLTFYGNSDHGQETAAGISEDKIKLAIFSKKSIIFMGICTSASIIYFLIINRKKKAK